MRFKKFLTFGFALVFLMAIASQAFAVNVTVTTTTKNLPENITCGQAGDILFTFTGTVGGTSFEIEGGDYVEFTLSDTSSLCKGLDFVVVLPTGDFDTTGSSPVWSTGAQAVGVVPNAVVSDTKPLAFRVLGEDGDQQVFMTWGIFNTADGGFYTRDAISADITVAQDEFFYISLFDQKTSENDLLDAENNPFHLVSDADDDIYLAAFSNTAVGGASIENALCIDLSVWAGAEYVEFTYDYLEGTPANNWSFSGDYRIARVLGSSSFTISYACGKSSECNTIALSEAQDGTLSGITFDMGDPAADEWGDDTNMVCDEDYSNGIMVYGTFRANTRYAVKFTLLYDGVEDEDLAAFTAAGDVDAYYITGSEFCGTDDGTALAADEVGDETTTTREYTYLVTSATWKGLVFDIPTIEVGDGAAVGKKITIKVEFSGIPCGLLATGTICAATIVDDCSAAPSGSLALPYLVLNNYQGWWTGVAVTNFGSTAATLSITLYGADGTAYAGTATVSVPGNGLKVYAIADLLTAAGISASSVDQASMVISSTSSSVEAIVMLGTSTQVHGYHID